MDVEEFDAWYVSAYPRIVGYLHAVTGDREEAEDCVQEAFVRAWAHRRTLSHERHPDAWVRTTAYRLAVSRWRRVVRGHRAPDRALAPATTGAGPDENHVTLVRALAQLPMPQRRALVLHHVVDLPIDEIVRETGAPAGTVKARLSRGRAALAQLLSEEEGAHHA